MLCSVCKKEQAIIFVHDSKDPNSSIGYCLNCAKEKGISLNNGNIDLNSVAEQFETILNNISDNVDLNDMNFEETGNVVPIGAIFGNIFNPQNIQNQSESKNINGKRGEKEVLWSMEFSGWTC